MFHDVTDGSYNSINTLSFMAFEFTSSKTEMLFLVGWSNRGKKSLNDLKVFNYKLEHQKYDTILYIVEMGIWCYFPPFNAFKQIILNSSIFHSMIRSGNKMEVLLSNRFRKILRTKKKFIYHPAQANFLSNSTQMLFADHTT